MGTKSKINLWLLIIFSSIATNCFGQKQLYLSNIQFHKLYLLPTGLIEKFKISGYEKSLNLKLINVLDSGILLEGIFQNSKLKEQRFFYLDNIVSMKKISQGHSFSRVLGGALIYTGVKGFTLIGTDTSSPFAFAYIIVSLSLTGLGLIPFLVPRRDLVLGNKWKLIIQ